MHEKNGAENQSIGAEKDFSSKSNLELLNEIDAILENCAADDADMDKVLENLDTLQRRAPVMQEHHAEAAWEEMAEKYPIVDQVEENSRKKLKRKGKKWLLHLASAAACILLAVAVTASAMGYNPFQSILRWGRDVVQVFGNPSGALEMPEGGDSEYTSLREALDLNGAEDAQCPTWIPKDYALSYVTVRQKDTGAKFTAVFYAERGDLVVTVQNLVIQDWTAIMEREETDEKTLLEIDGTTYITVPNANYIKAFWNDDQYIYTIRGNITEAELESLLKFI